MKHGGAKTDKSTDKNLAATIREYAVSQPISDGMLVTVGL